MWTRKGSSWPFPGFEDLNPAYGRSDFQPTTQEDTSDLKGGCYGGKLSSVKGSTRLSELSCRPVRVSQNQPFANQSLDVCHISAPPVLLFT